MSRRLWGWLGAAAASAAILVPSATAHATPEQADSTPVSSADADQPVGEPRGWHLSMSRDWILRGNRTNWNWCHSNPNHLGCPDQMGNRPGYYPRAGNGVFGHCKKRDKGGVLYVFITWNDLAGYVPALAVQPVDNVKKIKACTFL